MRVTIQLPPSRDGDQDMLNLDVGPSMTIEDLKAVVAVDTNLPAERQVFFLNGDILSDNSKTLEAVGILENDILVMQVRRLQPSIRPPPMRQRLRDDAEILRLQALEDPRVMGQLRQTKAELADAVQDSGRFHEIWERLTREQNEAEAEKDRTIARLNADPFDTEAQAKIEEMIREVGVMQNLQDTMENTPEAFGRVHMLYIPVEVNKVSLKAFVDSGAQATIMSPACAEKCNIMRLLDKRFAGIARGVGTAKILGRVHSAIIKIGTAYLACSFTVMEGKDVDLLLGLDMLKRHQACIDLRKGALVIENDEVPFLGEADIPKNEVLFSQEPVVRGPGGLRVGARSGAIMPPTQEQAPIPSSPQEGSASGQLQQLPEVTTAQIQHLMDLGFSREEVLRALDRAGGNVDVAAGILYQ